MTAMTSFMASSPWCACVTQLWFARHWPDTASRFRRHTH
jgi:hypothetical protein